MAAWHASATGRRGGRVNGLFRSGDRDGASASFGPPSTASPDRGGAAIDRASARCRDQNSGSYDLQSPKRRPDDLAERIERNEPLHLLVDSTGVKSYGEGEWLDQKHNVRSRRRWRKLHLAVDADTHEIAAVELTPDDVGDVSALPDLLDQIERPVASMIGNGAYDGQAVYDAVAKRHPEAAVIIPPRSTAVSERPRRRSVTNILRDGSTAWTCWLAAEFGIFPTEPGRNGNVQIQDHHRPTPTRPDTAQPKDRGEDRLQRSQSHDRLGMPVSVRVK